EQIAARVGPGPAHPGDPETGALGEPLALVGQERSVGRDDHDDRARTGWWREALVVVLEAGIRARNVRDRDRLADRHAVDPEPIAPTVVRLDENPDGEPAAIGFDHARGGADSTLELVADHPCPATDGALGDRP